VNVLVMLAIAIADSGTRVPPAASTPAAPDQLPAGETTAAVTPVPFPPATHCSSRPSRAATVASGSASSEGASISGATVVAEPDDAAGPAHPATTSTTSAAGAAASHRVRLLIRVPPPKPRD